MARERALKRKFGSRAEVLVFTDFSEGYVIFRQNEPINGDKTGVETKFFTESETESIVGSLPSGDSVRDLRDRAIVTLMLLEGMRRMEIYRACCEDIGCVPGRMRLLIRGRGIKRSGLPRAETCLAIERYLAARGPVAKDRLADPDVDLEPLFVAINRAGIFTARFSLRDLNRTVDKYLEKAGVKQSRKSCLALSTSESQRSQYIPVSSREV